MKNQGLDRIAYFDNAATTYPKPQSVYDFMDVFYRQFGGGSAGRGQYDGAEVAGLVVTETRMMLQDLFHTKQHEVLFTPSATEAMNLILRGYNWQDGMNVYISPFEHNAVIRVLHYLKKFYEIKVIQLVVDRDSLEYDLEKIGYQFQENQPNVVVISHASNVCGLVAPVEAIFFEAKKYESMTVLDMAQTAGLIDIDLNRSYVDCAIFAGHKTLCGPFGIAGIMKKQGIDIEPLIYGGTGMDSSNLDLPVASPERYEAGSRNILSIAGLHAALQWIKEVGIENIYKEEQKHKARLILLLHDYSNIQIIEAENQIGVISCLFDDYASDDIGKVLNEHGVAVRTGLHCAPFAHRFLNTFPAGTVRFSVGYFTKDEEFQILCNALDYIVENS